MSAPARAPKVPVWPEQLSFERLLTRPWRTSDGTVSEREADLLDNVADATWGAPPTPDCPACELTGDLCTDCLDQAVRDAISLG